MKLDAIVDWQARELDDGTFLFPLGINGGNNAVKAYVKSDYAIDGKILIPSMITEDDNNAFVSVISEPQNRKSALFQYVKGGFKDLKGKTIIVGKQAAGKSAVSVGETYGGKVDYLEHQILAVLNNLFSHSQFEDYSKFVVPLIVSIPHKNNVAFVEKAVKGTHTIRLNGDANREVEIEFQLLHVFPEGQAAGILLARLEQADTIATIDFGNGNTIYNIVSASGTLLSNHVADDGVRDLINQVSNSAEALEFNQEPIAYGYISEALENGKTIANIPFRGTWDFTECYQRILKRWALNKVKSFTGHVKREKVSPSVMLAIGGGSLLPGIKEILAECKIPVASDPQFIDSIALTLLAQAKYKKQQQVAA